MVAVFDFVGFGAVSVLVSHLTHAGLGRIYVFLRNILCRFFAPHVIWAIIPKNRDLQWHQLDVFAELDGNI